MASALVASQAVLCAVIGWVTFAGHGPQHVTAEPDLGPALVVPPATVEPVLTDKPVRRARPARTPVPSSSAPISAPASGSVLAEVSPAQTTTPPPTPAAPSPPAASEASPTPDNGELRATPVPSITEVQGNVVVGDKCDRENADGRTPTDVLVRCLKDRAGILVWQII